jgi:O-antigen ligase
MVPIPFESIHIVTIANPLEERSELEVGDAIPQTDGPGEATSRWTALILGTMMVLVPAVGVPSEEMLQDTLKSAIVALLTTLSAIVFLWLGLRQRQAVNWHVVLWLPLILAAYAIGSMAWSHTYLAGVEAVRWLFFSLLLWLGLNVRLDFFEERIVWGIHWGVTIASVWAALQFWTNFNVFPQGPNPASTFINRNFFAEYAVCALPYSVYLMVSARDFRMALGLAAIIGYNIVALMMTGTRSALVALSFFFLIAPVFLLFFRAHFAVFTWGPKRLSMLVVVLLGTIIGFGGIDTNNRKLVAESGQESAIARAVGRTATVTESKEYINGSFSVRTNMWAATTRMIAANPETGVGAGAWEVNIPLYQAQSTQMETDFYAHNEPLQLLAEYGATGWVFLCALFCYLTFTAWRVFRSKAKDPHNLTPLRLTALASLLLLLMVSNAGFPWRLAATGALFALSLSLLAACDAAENFPHKLLVRFKRVGVLHQQAAIAVAALSMVLVLFTIKRAAECEQSLIRGIKLAMTIARSGTANNSYWDEAKSEMLAYTRRGIELNSHYRKLTPLIGDELARMGDWKNALWVYESVFESRPHIVAIIANITRGHLEQGNLSEAAFFLDRANALQPTAPSVRALNALFQFRSGNESMAKRQIEDFFRDKLLDYDLVNAAYQIGKRTRDSALMIQSLELHKANWPQDAVDCWLKLGEIYSQESEIKNENQALHAYQSALDAAPEHLRSEVRKKIPQAYLR